MTRQKTDAFSSASGWSRDPWTILPHPRPRAVAGAERTRRASVASVPHDVDKYGIAGALAGQPIELVKCVSVDLEVPASAEIVLEGTLLAGKREVEGPFGDRGGTYGTVEPRPVIEIWAVTMRRDASTTRS